MDVKPTMKETLKREVTIEKNGKDSLVKVEAHNIEKFTPESIKEIYESLVSEKTSRNQALDQMESDWKAVKDAEGNKRVLQLKDDLEKLKKLESKDQLKSAIADNKERVTQIDGFMNELRPVYDELYPRKEVK